jgi:hypothetical protein
MDIQQYRQADRMAQAMSLLEWQDDEWQFSEWPWVGTVEVAPNQDSGE